MDIFSGHLSIKFSFFLHGESQVCASIDVRQHTPLRRLLPQHLNVAHTHPNTVQVILAPYGLAGVLTGHVYKASDYDIHRMLEEWRQFYILRDPVANNDGECVPPVVEVIVGELYIYIYIINQSIIIIIGLQSVFR